MSLPPARYLLVHHDNQWKINLDNRYFGPFETRDAAFASARDTAVKAAAQGYPASVLLLRPDGAVETLWRSSDGDGAPLPDGAPAA